MNERFHYPPTDTAIPDNRPLVFLAGPIQGSPDWQTPTAESLTRWSINAHTASPRRPEESNDVFSYAEQVEWELRHLRRARSLGVICFWFAAQDHSLTYEQGRSYAQTTRIEIGRIFGWYDEKPFPAVIGFDPEYTPNGGGSERYVRWSAEELGIPVYNSLEDVVDATVSAVEENF